MTDSFSCPLAFSYLQVRKRALHLALGKMLSLGITGYFEALCKNQRQLDVYASLYEEARGGERLPWASLALQCQSMDDVELFKVWRTLDFCTCVHGGSTNYLDISNPSPAANILCTPTLPCAARRSASGHRAPI
jgi:hypothetical protein